MNLRNEVKKRCRCGSPKATTYIAEAKEHFSITGNPTKEEQHSIFDYIINKYSASQEQAESSRGCVLSGDNEIVEPVATEEPVISPPIEETAQPTHGGQSPVLDEATRLCHLGIAVHILHPMSKRPIGNGWQNCAVLSAQKLQENLTANPGANIGIRTGSYSKLSGVNAGKYLIGIDLDIAERCSSEQIAEAHAARDSLLGTKAAYPEVQSGSGGLSRHYYAFTDEKNLPSNQKWTRSKDTFEVEVIDERTQQPRIKNKHFWEVEIMSTGKQVVLPPSIHPDSKQPYRWINPIHADNIPELPPLETISKQRDEVANAQKVVVPSEWKQIPLPEALTPKIKQLIQEGPQDGDRSTAIWPCLKELVKVGLSDNDICFIMAAPENAISEKALEEREGIIESAMAWIASQIPKARSEVKKDTQKKDTPLGGDFYLRKGGIYHKVVDDDGVHWTFVCSPLFIKSDAADPDSDNWGKSLEFSDKNGTIHNWTLPMSLTVGDGTELCSQLASKGLTLTSSRGGKQLLIEYILQAKASGKVICTPSTGWHGGVFVLPTETIGDSKIPVNLQSEAIPSRSAISKQGTMVEWQQHVTAYAVGNSRLLFAIGHSFSTPLLSILREGSGGFNFTGGSSIGKTTALVVGASAQGLPTVDGALNQWRSTDNALETTCQLHNDIAMPMDETGQVDARVLLRMVYMIGNNQSKARMSAKGHQRPVATWTTSVISTGEVSLSDMSARENLSVNAGQEVRFIDIPADAGCGLGCFENIHGCADGGEFSTMLVRNAKLYYGAAFHAFISELVKQPNRNHDNIKNYVDDFVKTHCPKGADGQVSRVCRRFGIVAVGGELATNWGITGWPSGAAEEAAVTLFKSWIAKRGGHGSQEEKQALKQVQHFLTQHGASRFEKWAGESNRTIINRAGYTKSLAPFPMVENVNDTVTNNQDEEEGEENAPDFYVLPAAFTGDICKGMDAKRVARTLHKYGYLEMGKKGKFAVPKKVPAAGKKTIRVYHIKATILDADFDEELTPEKENKTPDFL